jgi:23S rRNA pseudouridine1911/1915/1917 synthase
MQEGVVDAPLGKRQLKPGFERMTVCKDGIAAVTRYAVVSHSRQYSLVRASLVTGRKHQIRAHLAHIGCPLVGDAKFGASTVSEVFLHAAQLSFVHPASGALVELHSELPPDFRAKVRVLGLKT